MLLDFIFMKYYIYIFICFAVTVTFSQNSQSIQPPFSFIEKSCYFKDNLDSLDKLLYKDFSKYSTENWYKYQSSVLYSKRKMYFDVFIKLDELIKSGVNYQVLLSNPNFKKFKNTIYYSQLCDSIKVNVLKNDYVNSNIEFIWEIHEMFIEDQTVRSFFKKDFCISEKERLKLLLKTDKTNKVKLSKVLDTMVFFPIYSDYGKHFCDEFYTLIDHNLSSIKNFDLFKEKISMNVKLNEMNGFQFAIIIDTYCYENNLKQIYGTQIYGSNNKKGDYIQFLYPVENEKELNDRRLEIGLKRIEEYLKKFNLEYYYNSEVDKMNLKESIFFYLK